MVSNSCTTHAPLRYVSAREKSRATFTTCHVAHSAWPVRFGYARWLRHLETGEAPSFADIGREVERTGQAVSSWAKADAPPTDFRVHAPLAGYLGVPERWLIQDVGEPPRPELWGAWTAAREP